jgi:hypothetical protein
MTRLTQCWVETRWIERKPAQHPNFPRRYTAADIPRFAEVDAAHEDLSGPAVRRQCRRGWTVFGDAKVQRLAEISASSSTMTMVVTRPLVSAQLRPCKARFEREDGRSLVNSSELPQSAGSHSCHTDCPLVSIVTPAYNAAPWIQRTIESVLAQDYPRIEYTIMDGGSVDGTVEVIRRYEGRLKYVSAPDGGTADAVNRGFVQSHGSIFAWLSADDLYAPGAVRKAVDRLTSNPEIGVLYGAAYWIDAADRIIGPYPTGAFAPQCLTRECFICQPAVFMRADAFRRVGMLDVSDHFTFDYDLWIRFSRDARFEFLPETLAMSRMRRDNKTLGARKEILEASIALLRKHYGYVPVQWVYGYASYLLHPGDQFFSPPPDSIKAFAMSLPLGSWINRARPLRYWAEWLSTALRGISRVGARTEASGR